MKSFNTQSIVPISSIENTGPTPVYFTPHINSRAAATSRMPLAMINNAIDVEQTDDLMAKTNARLTQILKEQELEKSKTELENKYIEDINYNFAAFEANDLGIDMALQMLSENLALLFIKLYPEQSPLSIELIKTWIKLIDLIANIAGYKLAVYTSMNKAIIELQQSIESLKKVLDNIKPHGSGATNIFHINHFITVFFIFGLCLKCHDDLVYNNADLSKILHHTMDAVLPILSNAQELNTLIATNNSTNAMLDTLAINRYISKEKVKKYNTFEGLFFAALNFNLNLTGYGSTPELEKSLELMSPISLFSPSSSSSTTACVGSNLTYTQSTKPEPLACIQEEAEIEAKAINRSVSAFQNSIQTPSTSHKRLRRNSW